MNSNDSETGKESHGILLIGNAAGAISVAHASDQLPISICTGMQDGIEAVVNNPFTAILVVMADAANNLRTDLASLRKLTSAKILLLARMYEEPLARNLSRVSANGAVLADDYVICPIQVEKLCQALQGAPIITVDRGAPVTNTSLETKIRHLEKLATEDDLTGLKNRRYILEFAKQIIERSTRENGRVTVLIFDIDNFKYYNDVYGHAAGDEVLKQAARLIQRCCRKHDMVARLGGDEFAVVFWDDPQCPQPTAAGERRSFTADHPREVISIAKRFRKELETTELRMLGPEGKGVLTISGGLAGLGADGLSTEELFAKADQALLEAKRSGKNRVYLVGRPENDIDKI
jgi:PleD family two-component response regulator